MIDSIKRFFLSSVRTVMPLECPVCGQESFDGTPDMFCAECMKKLPFIKSPECPSCGGELDGILDVCSRCLREGKRPWKRAFSVFRMEPPLNEIIYHCKYGKEPEMASAIGVLAGRKIAESGVKINVVTAVPLHWTRKLTRGFNQSEEIARKLCQEAHLEYAELLRRVKMTRQQARLDRDERKKNLKDAFEAKNLTKLEKRAILLVDDVLTTGSTLSAAAQVLLAAGAEAVYVLSAARR